MKRISLQLQHPPWDPTSTIWLFAMGIYHFLNISKYTNMLNETSKGWKDRCLLWLLWLTHALTYEEHSTDPSCMGLCIPTVTQRFSPESSLRLVASHTTVHILHCHSSINLGNLLTLNHSPFVKTYHCHNPVLFSGKHGSSWLHLVPEL